MSLRARLIVLTLLVLAASLLLGAALALWHAAGSVRTELQASLEVGEQGLRNGVADLADVPDPAADARRLVATFDGNRHVQAVLLDRRGAMIASSHPLLPEHPVPAWLLWAVQPNLAAVRIDLPEAAHRGSIVLQPFPANEASEAWTQYGDSGITLGVFCLLMSVLILWVVGRGLRPLTDLAVAFKRIGAGDYSARVAPVGAAELVDLATGFNHMAAALAVMQTQNFRLHEQLLTLQDEERADLARDLHDEIGPFLFSVNVTAASISHLVAAGRVADIPAQISDIREAVAHMQMHVQSILSRLRQIRAVEFGLAVAIANVVAFWQGRHQSIAFCTEIDAAADDADDAAQEVAYRVVQESLSNAVRHGAPSRVELHVSAREAGLLVRVADDGDGGSTSSGGFGLTGMRERVAALGGALTVGPHQQGRGWLVEAHIPVSAQRSAP